MNPVGLALLCGGIVVFGAIFYFGVLNESAPSCPGHWHATFALYVPDETGAPVRIDFGAPLTPQGQQYYDFRVDPLMTAAAHMHQTGAEQGSAALGPAQWHFEGSKCVGIQTALKTADVVLGSDSVKVSALHGLANAGEWKNEGDEKLRIFFQTQDESSKNWTWGEVQPSRVLHTQAKDGESFLVAFGNFTDEQIDMMEKSIIAPISRQTS